MKIRSVVLFILFLLIACGGFAQHFVRMEPKYGTENKDLQNVLNFENIYLEQLSFKGPSVNGKQYKIVIKEFLDGRLKDSSVLFDGTELDLFMVNEDSVSVSFAFKLADGNLKAQVFGQGFGSQKVYLPLLEKADDYALKDFFGSNKQLTINIDTANAILAIITPTIHEDGSGSYCEVAQSDVLPEALGRAFKIPHYFVIYISFV